MNTIVYTVSVVFSN